MKATRYFSEQVLRKRPYIQLEWCERALISPLRREVQPDGRIRHWCKVEAKVEAMSASRPRYVRVVTLADGETVHNAFLDRDFREDGA